MATWSVGVWWPTSRPWTTLWPKLGDTRDSKEAFVLHGRDMMAALCEHYAGVLEGAGRTKEAAVQEYRLYKTWARTRETSARETYLTLLKRGMCCLPVHPPALVVGGYLYVQRSVFR